METKTLKIEVPKGYEIDKEKSTFENIVFKKVDGVEIKWNECHNGVEIKADDEHFILKSSPTYIMSWNDAIRHFYNSKHRSHIWNLPTVKQLQVIHKYFNEINKKMEENDGFVLYYSSYWSIEEIDSDNARYVSMSTGGYYGLIKRAYYYVRGVVTL